ncbi:MAG: hypothetical protein GVY30_06930 [Chloroflexi bacterium]|jgi:DNA modification methylase|nr:hypothetical protein [Chloroflexota bacterium]
MGWLVNGSAARLPLATASVHCAVTSPPYWGLRKYAGEQARAWPAVTYTPMAGLPPITVPAMRAELGLEPTPEAFVGHIVLAAREVWRVLRDDGTLWLNFGDSYATNPSNGRSESVDSVGMGGVPHRSGMDKSRAGLKAKDLCGIPWRVAFALQADGWWLRSDIIWHKCLSGGTKVYARTQNGAGPDTIKDLARLDPSTVQLWNGAKWTQVKGFHETPRPKHPIEIVLRSGERIGCTPDHRWPTQRGLRRADELQAGDVLDWTTLPEPEDTVTPDRLPNSIGWFVGMYLAEGSKDSTDTIQIASHIDEQGRFNLLKQISEAYGGTCRQYQTSDNGMTIRIHSPILVAILDIYLSGHTAKNKRLSPAAWKRDNDFLRNLLNGYLEGDGHHDQANDRYRLGFTRNYYLEQDLRTLCARLDYQLRLNPVRTTSQNGDHKGFRGEIRFKRSDHHNAKEDMEIVEIRRSRARKFWDIEVEDEPHLFALSSGVLTHNSNPMPESVTDRCTKAHEYLFLLAKSERYFYDHEAVKEESIRAGDIPGGGRPDTNAAEPRAAFYRPENSRKPVASTRNKRTVWKIATKPYHGAHFATFPPGLAEPCILAGTSERGVCPECGAPWERVVESTSHYEKREAAHAYNNTSTKVDSTGWTPPTIKECGWRPTCDHDADPVPATVLDPFCGSGTTGVVCQEHGRRFVGVDVSGPYLRKQARKRLGLEALAAWTSGKRVGEITAPTPLFSAVGQELAPRGRALPD